MREKPRTAPRPDHALSIAGKWISRVSWSAFSRQELEELQVELASSAECRRRFIEDRIFAQCLREVFRRLDSPGLAVVQVSPRPGSAVGTQSQQVSGITLLPKSQDGVAAQSKSRWRPVRWQAVAAVGIAGVFVGFGGAKLASRTATAARPEIRPLRDGLTSVAAGGTFLKAVFRGEVAWSSFPERAFSVQQGVLEVESSSEAEPWRVVTPSGKLQVGPGYSRVEFEARAGIRIKVWEGSACWVPEVGTRVDLKAGSEYAQPR